MFLFIFDCINSGIGDCINVSWYMAIDMQFFIITPIILSLIWKSPKIGYTLVGVLFTTGTACQIAFTIVDDEFFHGGFSFYIKPWNRSQPYLIGLLLGIFLHKVCIWYRLSKLTLSISSTWQYFIFIFRKEMNQVWRWIL